MSVSIVLPPAPVPDESFWGPALGAEFHTGTHAVEAAFRFPGGPVALDIETPSVTDCFSVKCVTAAWEQSGRTHAVLLDPSRNAQHVGALRAIIERGEWLIMHNAGFDVIGLTANGWMTLDEIDKVMDTVVMSRAAFPSELGGHRLEDLAPRVLGMSELKGALKLAQTASGLTSKEKWYRDGDIHIPVYRMGAMSDTVVTLRLAAPLFDAAVARQLDHPFTRYGHTSRDTAAAMILDHQEVNRVLLWRAAKGYTVDTDHLDRYSESVHIAREEAEKLLTETGLRPGVGADIVNYLDKEGHLPENWPRTPTGKLKSDKAAMERMPGHPLALAHTTVAESNKILGYMQTVAARSAVTGRLHPQWGVLAASATGRMSCSEPALQQFSEQARPILRCDEDVTGFNSVDWSSIEPALLGWMAQDWEFIEPFENGADIYEPIQRSAGSSRKVAKVVVLAGMYGQGRSTLAANLGISVDDASDLQRQMRNAMPKSVRFMAQIKQIAEDHGVALSLSGRVLPIPSFNGVVAVHKAVNYTFQSSCADLIYEAILGMKRAGIAQHLYLPMHDEIVCATEVADEVNRIMQTPSEMLLRRTGGRVPIIRTDNQSIGPAWVKC
jgi:DNA polymerase-1